MAVASVPKAAPVKFPPTRIERVAISRLKAAPYNPRKMNPHAAAGLGNSIDRFGLVQPIIFNSRTGNVVGGHQRLKHLKKSGMKGSDQLDVVVVDLDESEEKALNIALNNPGIAGEFDGRLADLLGELQARGDGLFEALHFEDLLETAEAARRHSVSFDAAGDGHDQLGAFEFSVIVRCRDEVQQVELLERFAAEGLTVKALTI